MWNDLEQISSRQNRRLKGLLRLENERNAKKDGVIVAEGLRQVHSSLELEEAEEIFFADDERGRNCFEDLRKLLPDYSGFQNAIRLEASLFRIYADTEQSQGVLATFQAPSISSPKEKFASDSRIIILEEIQDPGNLGTICRTVEALGFQAIVLLGPYVWPYNRKSLRASMGTALRFPFYEASSWEEIFPLIEDLDLLTADMGGVALSSFMNKQSKGKGFALLLGNEARGVSEEAKEHCKHIVAVEMQGKAESLNIAAAAAILSYSLSQAYGFI